jgi:hypothetical protein
MVSFYAKPAKKFIDKISLDEKRYVSLSAFSPCKIVELKLSLRTRLARQTHAQSVEKFVTSLV